MEISTALTLERDGAWVSHLRLGSHTGTHVDAPAHLVAGGRTVDRLDLAELCGPAVILGLESLAGSGRHAPLTADRLRPLIERFAPSGPETLPPRVLVHTGYAHNDPAHTGHPRTGHPHTGAHTGPDSAVGEHPYLTQDAARLLWDAGVRLLGIDTPSPDPSAPSEPLSEPPAEPPAGPQPEATGLPVHRVFLGGDGILVENLTGLSSFRPVRTPIETDWTARITLGVYPLPLAGRDGAPARVVARPRGTDERTPPC